MFDVMKFNNVFKVNENGTVCVYIVNQFGKQKKTKIDNVKEIKVKDGTVQIKGKNGLQDYKFSESGIYESIKKYFDINDKKDNEE